MKPKPKKPKPATLSFTSTTGHVVKLPVSMTLGDLARLGIKLRLRPACEPVPRNWYAHPKP